MTKAQCQRRAALMKAKRRHAAAYRRKIASEGSLYLIGQSPVKRTRRRSCASWANM